MKIKRIEKALRAAKFHHLTEDMLAAYLERKLNGICQSQAEAHLELCLICERRLLLIQKEQAADEGEITDEERDSVGQVLQQTEWQPSEGSKSGKR